jgi:EpsI family protein
MNGFRAYLLILIGHVTDMRFDHDGWHVRLGQILFVIVLFAFFKIGARYRDDTADPPGAVPASERAGASGTVLQGVLVVFAGLIALGVPAKAGNSLGADGPSAAELAGLVPALEAAPGWRPLPVRSISWRPSFVGGAEPVEASFENSAGRVDVLLRAYPIPADEQNEMVTFRNRIQPDSDERLYPEKVITLNVDGFGELEVRETTVKGSRDRLVWYWYDVNGALAATSQEAKLWEAWSLFTKGAGVQKVIVVSTAPITEQSRGLLMDFLRDHAGQVLPADAGS